MTFYTDSYLEYFLTLLGWIINNGVFSLFVGTGLWLLPLIGLIIKTWLDVGKQGDDEGEKGELLIRWLYLNLIPAMFVVILVLAPVIPVSLDNIGFNVERSKQCGYKVPLEPSKTGYGSYIESTFGGKQARVPLWWAMMHKINKGLTHGFASTIPCQIDLRQVRFEVQHEKINNPALLTEVQQFTQQCYVPARRKVQESQVSLNEAQAREISWLGGKLFIKNSELYPRYRAQQPIKPFPYDNARDAGLPNNGNGGYPTCDQWWDNAEAGLRPRLLADMRQNLSAQVSDFFNSVDNQDEALLRTLLRPENIDVSKGKVYPGYGGNLDPTMANAAARTAAGAGSLVGSLAIFPGLDSLRQALPMIQAFLIMVVIILTPAIIILSAYSLKTVITITFVHFAIVTTSFWWELARWLDSALLDILYNSSAHSRINPYFLENTQDDFIINFVMGSLFIVVPALWFTAMGWAGIKTGDIAQSMANGAKSSQAMGEKTGNMAGNVAQSKINANMNK
jgi:conserved putative membrane protein